MVVFLCQCDNVEINKSFDNSKSADVLLEVYIFCFDCESPATYTFLPQLSVSWSTFRFRKDSAKNMELFEYFVDFDLVRRIFGDGRPSIPMISVHAETPHIHIWAWKNIHISELILRGRGGGRFIQFYYNVE